MPARYPSGKVRKGKHRFYMDGGLRTCLENIKADMELHDQDGWIIITGDVGTGKTILGSQICAYLYPRVTLSNVTFDGDTFLNKMVEQKKFTAIQFDEAVHSMMGTESITKMGKRLAKAMWTSRVRQLYYVLCIPDAKDLTQRAFKRAHLWVQ